MPLAISFSVPCFPHLQINDIPDLVEALGWDQSKSAFQVELYNVERDGWDCPRLDTTHTVKTNEVLLFRLLPDGIHGRRLADCPQLDEEIKKLQGQVVFKGKRHCTSVDEDHSLKRQRTTPGIQTVVEHLDTLPSQLLIP